MKATITALVIIHVVVALWHGDAHSSLAIELPFFKNLFVYVVILGAPIVGAALLWTGYRAHGAALVGIAAAAALVFGAYHHYVLVSPDNIAHLPAGAAASQAQFIDSAAVIAINELLLALAGFYALGQLRQGQRRPDNGTREERS